MRIAGEHGILTPLYVAEYMVPSLLPAMSDSSTLSRRRSSGQERERELGYKPLQSEGKARCRVGFQLH